MSTERRRGFSVRDQLRVLVPLVFVWAFGFSCLALVAVQDDVGEMLLDPSWIGGSAWYVGFVSQFGAVTWTVAAAVASSASWLAARCGRPAAATFLRMGAFATTVLLLDDLFGFHALAGAYGFPKPLAQVLVFAPVVVWGSRYRDEILRTRFQLLGASIAAIGTSFAVDVFVAPNRFDFSLLFEDGAKFLGVLAWATYFVVTSRDIAASALASSAQRSAPVDLALVNEPELHSVR